jgi:hypothetical protein
MIKSRMKRWAGHILRMGERSNAYRIFVEQPERKKRPRRKWVDNIKIDLRMIGWGGMHWIDLSHDRDQWTALVNTVINLRVLQNVGNFLSSCVTCGFSRRAELHEVC